MTWAHVASALRRAVSDFLNLVLSAAVESADMYGPAPRIAPKSNASGPTISASTFRARIERRALVKSNRSKAAAARYLDRHMSLFSETYSGAGE